MAEAVELSPTAGDGWVGVRRNETAPPAAATTRASEKLEPSGDTLIWKLSSPTRPISARPEKASWNRSEAALPEACFDSFRRMSPVPAGLAVVGTAEKSAALSLAESGFAGSAAVPMPRLDRASCAMPPSSVTQAEPFHISTAWSAST